MGYLLKDKALDVSAGAIRAVAEGGTWHTAEEAQQPVRAQLRDREQEGLWLVAAGQTNREIGVALHVSKKIGAVRRGAEIGLHSAGALQPAGQVHHLVAALLAPPAYRLAGHGSYVCANLLATPITCGEGILPRMCNGRGFAFANRTSQ
jgi:hypothetical protein